MRCLCSAEIGEDCARAFEQCRDGPARGEDAGHHAQRDRIGREAGVDELGGRLCRAQPDARAEPAEYAETMSPEPKLLVAWREGFGDWLIGVGRMWRCIAESDEERETDAENG